jgi:hypothetical protein
MDRRSISPLRVIQRLSLKTGAADYLAVSQKLGRSLDRMIALVRELEKQEKIVMWETRDGARKLALHPNIARSSLRPLRKRIRPTKEALPVKTATDLDLDLDTMPSPFRTMWQKLRIYTPSKPPPRLPAVLPDLQHQSEFADALCMGCPCWSKGEVNGHCSSCEHIKTWEGGYCLKFYGEWQDIQIEDDRRYGEWLWSQSDGES